MKVYQLGRTIWFDAQDVLRVIRQKPSSRHKEDFDVLEYDSIPETWRYGFSEEGVEKLLKSSIHRDALPMFLWVQRQVVKPFHRAFDLRK